MTPKLLRTASLPALALAVAFGAHASAQAAPPTAEQAKALEAEVRNALATLVGGSVDLPSRPVELTPEGDHYRVRVPLGVLGRIEPTDAAVTMRARMVDGGRWSLEDEQFPPRLQVTASVDVPDPAGAGDGPSGGSHKEMQSYGISVGRQDVHGLFDPTFATPTTSEGTITSIDVARVGGSLPSRSHFGRVVTQASIRPISPERIDVLSDASTEDYVTENALPDGTAFKMTAQVVRVVSSLAGVAHAQLLPLLHSAIEATRLQSRPGVPADADAEKAALRRTLVAANAALTGGRIEETASGVTFDYGGHAGSLAKLAMAFGGTSPEDMLTTTMGFTLDGLVIDELPPQLAAYVPTHFTMRPIVSNVSVKDLTRMAMDATQPGDGKVSPQDMQAAFSHGGINFSFDPVELDIAGTQFAGAGRFTMTGPQAITGEAEITAHDLDGLIAKAQANPLLARGVPAIIFLKGIAHTAGDQAVWQVSVADDKVLVNGMDLGAMAGALQ